MDHIPPEREAADIRTQVKKILNGLGNPEPPLDLRLVRELLKLDRQFYSTTDDGVLREMVSKVTIAGKQLLKRPSLLLEVVKKAQLSALWLPDRKRILIDSSVPLLKHRWNEGHEIQHAVIPWHGMYLMGDDDITLRPHCYAELEREANYGTGQLLFLMERFPLEAQDYPASLSSVQKLGKAFGNTITSTLWRFVEDASRGAAMVGVVSEHPLHPSSAFDALAPCKYFIRSPTFAAKFSSIDEITAFGHIAGYCTSARGGPLGESEIILNDDNGVPHLFRFESFCNRHEVLTLGVHCRKLAVR